MVRWLIALGLFLGMTFPLRLAYPCDKHPIDTTEPASVHFLENTGLLAAEYDRDGDGVNETVLLFQVDESNNPLGVLLFYFEGVDKDGKAREVYIDEIGKANCLDIRLYYKRFVHD